ncbi:MAG TPA: hypothetical protein PLE28_03360 [bacterium]|nr:hypothetical protein [bacterium]
METKEEYPCKVANFLEFLSLYPEDNFHDPVPRLFLYLDDLESVFLGEEQDEEQDNEENNQDYENKKIDENFLQVSGDLFMIESIIKFIIIFFIKDEVLISTKEMFIEDAIEDLSYLLNKDNFEIEDCYEAELVLGVYDVYKDFFLLAFWPDLDVLVDAIENKLDDYDFKQS